MYKPKKYFVCEKFDDDRVNKHCVFTKYVYYNKNDTSPIEPKDKEDFKENKKYYIIKRGCKYSKCNPNDNCCKRVAAYLYSVAETENQALLQAEQRPKRLRLQRKGFDSSTDNSEENEKPSSSHLIVINITSQNWSFK